MTYWYAWKGGPALQGQPGSPEFVASYNEAASRKVTPTAGVIFSILQGYQASEDFRGLSERTRKDYVAKIKQIEKAFGDFPLSGLPDRRTRGIFMAWRDRLAAASRRQADYSVGGAGPRPVMGAQPRPHSCQPLREGWAPVRRYSRRQGLVALTTRPTSFVRGPARLHLPLLLALWTGQRQGDLLRLPWSGYDGTHIRLRQSKGGVRVVIPVGAPLKAALDVAAKSKQGPLILVNSDGKPWTADGFRSSWRKACAAAGVVGVTFHDLRGTAVTRLALVGATEAEIASITGHSLRDVRTILDSHYLHRDPALAESAIRKLEKGTKTPN